MPSTVWYQAKRFRAWMESVLDTLSSAAERCFLFAKRAPGLHAASQPKGSPVRNRKEGLRDSLRERNHFLPCQLHRQRPLGRATADFRRIWACRSFLAARSAGPDVVRLRLDADRTFAGCRGSLRTCGARMAWCAATRWPARQARIRFADLHIRRYADGQMSRWLCDGVEVGAELEVQGRMVAVTIARRNPPATSCSSAVAPAWVRFRHRARGAGPGHRGEIFPITGPGSAAGLYLDDELRDLAAQHANLHYCGCVVTRMIQAIRAGWFPTSRYPGIPCLSGFRVFLAGSPEMVHATRYRVVQQGAARAFIHADPFETQHPHMPDDAATVAAIAPSPSYGRRCVTRDGRPRSSAILQPRLRRPPLLSTA